MTAQEGHAPSPAPSEEQIQVDVTANATAGMQRVETVRFDLSPAAQCQLQLFRRGIKKGLLLVLKQPVKV